MFATEDVGVFLGLDVGRTAHHGHGLTPAGKKVFDKQLPNSEPKLGAVFDRLAAKFGTVLVIVDQPASIGALPLTVARDVGCKVAYLPGLAMRRIADPYRGEAKTGTKDAAVIADAARTIPPHPALAGTDRRDHRRTDRPDRLRPGPRRRGHSHQQPDTRPAHRVPPQPGTCPWPPPRPPGGHLARPTLWLPGRPAKSRPPQTRRPHPVQGPAHGRPGDRRCLRRTRRTDRRRPRHRHPRHRHAFPGHLARRRPHPAPGAGSTDQRPAGGTPSFPGPDVDAGVGVRTAAVLLVTVGDGASFPTAAHLSSYAGLAPTTRQSGTSIHGEHAPRCGNRQLKRAMFPSAFACMNAAPASRAYYDKQRARGKTHTQALLRLARQRISVLFAMLRDGIFYETRNPEAAAA